MHSHSQYTPHAQIWERPTYVRRVERPEPPHPIPDNRPIVIVDWEHRRCWIVLGELSYCYFIFFGWKHVYISKSLLLRDTQLHILSNEHYVFIAILINNLVQLSYAVDLVSLLSCKIICNFWKTSMLFHVMGMLIIDLSNNALGMLGRTNARNAKTKEQSAWINSGILKCDALRTQVRSLQGMRRKKRKRRSRVSKKTVFMIDQVKRSSSAHQLHHY